MYMPYMLYVYMYYIYMIQCPGGPPLVWKPIPCASVGGWWCGCGGGSSTASTATDTRGEYHLEEGGETVNTRHGIISTCTYNLRCQVQLDSSLQ